MGVLWHPHDILMDCFAEAFAHADPPCGQVAVYYVTNNILTGEVVKERSQISFEIKEDLKTRSANE
jgi:hypothetical protein